jgi:pimeloyl-ACP methyl ester carboxylesterase
VNILKTALVFIIATLLSACGEEYTAAWLEAKYSDKTSNFVTIDGNRIHYRDECEGKGENECDQRDVIVLIHGTSSSLQAWDKWAVELVNQYRIVRMDLTGSGLTGPDSNDRYEVKNDVVFISKLLQHLNIQHAHIVGSSLGGRIAWQYALEFPNHVSSLTLINALGYPQDSWPPAIEMGQWPIVDKLVTSLSSKFMYRYGLEDVYFSRALIDDELVDRYFELSQYPGNSAALLKRVKARLDKDSNLIAGIRVPTLVLWGENDIYFPVRNAHRFKDDIKNSQIYTYSNVGHLPMEEVPEISLIHFLSFIKNEESDYENPSD